MSRNFMNYPELYPWAGRFPVTDQAEPEFETRETQDQKLPARGAKKPNADEQEGDLGDHSYPEA